MDLSQVQNWQERLRQNVGTWCFTYEDMKINACIINVQWIDFNSKKMLCGHILSQISCKEMPYIPKKKTQLIQWVAPFANNSQMWLCVCGGGIGKKKPRILSVKNVDIKEFSSSLWIRNYSMVGIFKLPLFLFKAVSPCFPYYSFF